jgi:hypothetical protein
MERSTDVAVIIKNKVKQDSVDCYVGGARKETARRTSLECPGCAVVYVSQNGSIEVYVDGASWSIAEAIGGLGGF